MFNYKNLNYFFLYHEKKRKINEALFLALDSYTPVWYALAFVGKFA